MPGGFECGRGERSGIHTALLQIHRRQIYLAERRFEFIQRCGKLTVCRQAGMFTDVLRSGKENRALVAQISVDAGFILQFVHKLGVHARARGREGLKHRRHFEREVGQHSRGGMGCFATGLSAFHDEDSGAALAQRDRK